MHIRSSQSATMLKWVLKLVAGVAASVCLLVPMSTAQEAPARKPNVAANPEAMPAGKEEQSVRIYGLKHANGQLLSELLPAVFPAAHVVLDSTNNRLVVMASASEHGRLEKLISEFDVSAPEEQIKVFSLVNVEASTMLEAVSSIGDSAKVKLAVDPRSNSLLAAGPASELAAIEAILLKLDEKSQVLPEKSFRVRIVWFAEGPPDGETTTADGDLAVVLQELSKIGIAGLRPIGQTTVSTAVGGKFHVNCPAILSADAAELRIQGELTLRQVVPRLAIDISARRGVVTGDADDAAARRVELVQLSTEIVAPLGHFVVLGTTPVHEKTMAFAVQVQVVE